MTIVILVTQGNHWHDCIISIRGEEGAHKTSLTPPFVLLKCLY